MRVVIKHPGAKPYTTDMPNTLEALQWAVGGYIEVIAPANGFVLILNEEGKFKNLAGNLIIMGEDDEILDIIVGTVIAVGTFNGDFESLDSEQEKAATEWLTEHSIIK